MLNYHKEEITQGALFKTNIEKLMRCYGGGTSTGSGQSINRSGSSGSGTSTFTSASAPQLTPAQLMSLYSGALPTIGNTTGAVAANTPAGQASNAAVQGGVSAVNAINLNGLSPGESNAIERSNNQGLATSGNLGLNNPTNTEMNAANFGGAFNQKIGLLNSAVGAASGASNAANTTTGTTASLFNPIGSNANGQVSSSKSNSIFGNSSAGSGAGTSANNSGNFGCFLTTACCEFKGLPDDCEELKVLRNFRDSFVPRELVDRYYSIAPNICMRIQGDSATLNYVYRVVQQCVSDIKKGRNKSALRAYKLMVHKLERN